MGIERYADLSRLVEEAKAHYVEFVDGKKVAATKARKSLQQIKRLAQECRIDIQTVKKERTGGGGASRPLTPPSGDQQGGNPPS